MVILFSIDGMRPDALQAADAPHIHGLAECGAATFSAQTVMPSVTLPCHTSMLRGVDVPRHGVTSNTFAPLARPVPSVMDVASLAGLRCGFFYNWGPLRDLADPESTVVSHYCQTSLRPDGDSDVAEAAIRSINRDRLDFAFVYLGVTDEVGHAEGWMSPSYMKAIHDADECVGRVLAAVDSATSLVISDHGGHGKSHGTEMPEDMTIPWILSGPRIRAGHSIVGPVRIFDTAPTLARLLGLEAARQWEGSAITEAISDPS